MDGAREQVNLIIYLHYNVVEELEVSKKTILRRYSSHYRNI